MKSLVAALACLVVSAVTQSGALDDDRRTSTSASLATLERDARALVEARCIDCHATVDPSGELDLEGALGRLASDSNGDASPWRAARARLVDGSMPPKGEERPTVDEIARFASWIDARFGVETPLVASPGRPTLRRLNRAEYQNTVRDLFGVEIDASTELPTDDVGHGFDSIGDVLSYSDVLFEKHFKLAERVAARAVLSPDAAEERRRVVAGSALTKGSSSNVRGKARVVFSNGEVGASFDVPRDGEYTLRALVFGDQAGPDPARAALRFGRRELGRFDVPARAEEPQTIEVALRVPAGRQRFAVAFVNDYYQPQAPAGEPRDRNLGVVELELVGPLDAPAYSRFQRTELDPLRRADLETVVARAARRVWRRPVSESELARLHSLARAQATFEDGVRIALQALLVSPHFCFRIESDEVDASSAATAERVHTLDSHELATRLSYFLWSSCPDAELDRLADDGALVRDDVLRAQVTRMLRDARASALTQNFAGQWLQLRSLERAAPDPERFPDFDDELRAAMRGESELFFEAILREGRGVQELLTADFTFVNERLARHYGITGVRGAHLQRIKLDGGARGGLLSHASVLTVTSNPTRTSPVKRGKWILENVLAAPTPPAPPGVGDLPDSVEAERSASLRERMARHRVDPNCSGCHERLDPLGFGLEHFDAVGAWRARDGAHPVDALGELPDGRRFSDAQELQRMLADDPGFVRCVLQKLFVYAVGRGIEDGDHAWTESTLRRVGRNPTLATLIGEIVASDAFQKRALARTQDAK